MVNRDKERRVQHGFLTMTTKKLLTVSFFKHLTYNISQDIKFKVQKYDMVMEITIVIIVYSICRIGAQ